MRALELFALKIEDKKGSKVKKHLVALLTVACLVMTIGLVGCGNSSSGEANSGGNSGDSVVGTWSLSGIEVDGVNMPKDYVDSYIQALGEDVLTMTFEENGIVVMSFVGESPQDYMYTYSDGKGTVEGGGEKLEFEIDGKQLKLDTMGTILVFSK